MSKELLLCRHHWRDCTEQHIQPIGNEETSRKGQTDSDGPESKEDKLESGQRRGHWKIARVDTSCHQEKMELVIIYIEWVD
jgi:hypothetical protein